VLGLVSGIWVAPFCHGFTSLSKGTTGITLVALQLADSVRLIEDRPDPARAESIRRQAGRPMAGIPDQPSPPE
jgi:hypothetical protein